MPKHKPAITGSSEPSMLTAALLDGEKSETPNAVTDKRKLPKAVRRLLDLLAELELTAEDLETHKINAKELAHILELPWYDRAQRWLVYDETIRKLLLLPLLRDKNIRLINRGSIFDLAASQVELRAINEDPERAALEEKPQTTEESLVLTTVNSKKYCVSLRGWFNSHFYPESNSFLFSRIKALRKVFFVTGMVEGIETITMRIWSTLLLSFMAIDLYYYYAYPDDRYGQTLSKIFFASSNEVGLSAALTYPTVWPELFALPIAWGVLNGLLQTRLTKGIKKGEREKLLKTLQHYHARSIGDCAIWLLPIHPLQTMLKKAELLLLWDGHLIKDEREELFKAIIEVAKHATKLTQLQALTILSELVDYPAPKDLLKLSQHVSKDPLLHQLALKQQAYEELQKHASSYQPEDQEQKAKHKITKVLAPLPRYLYANYLLWCLGKPESKLLQPLFWSYKIFLFYLKGRLLWAIAKGITALINRYLDELDCKRQGKLWIWMNRVGDYKCTVCGDLSISYKYIFTLQNCVQAYLKVQRTEEEITAFLKRYDLSSFKSFDLSNQRLNSTSFGNVLSELYPRIPHLETLLLNLTGCSYHPCVPDPTRPIIGISSGLKAILNLPALIYLDFANRNLNSEALALVEQIISKSRLNYLDLSYNSIGSEGMKNLTAALQSQSALNILYLVGNNIGDTGAEILVSALSNQRLHELYLHENNIGVQGITAIAAELPRSSLNLLHLMFNHIGDSGTKILAAGSSKSNLTSLNLRGNQIGDEGAKTLAAILSQSPLQRLSLIENDIGNEGAKAFAAILSKSNLWSFSIGGNRIGNEGLNALVAAISSSKLLLVGIQSDSIQDEDLKNVAAMLSQSNLWILDLESNNIGNEGIKTLAAVLPETKIWALILHSNKIGYEGIQALAHVLSKTQLQMLELDDTKIGDEGVSALVEALPYSKLWFLALGNNSITDKGAGILASSLTTYQSHRSLWIYELNFAEQKALTQVEPNTLLTALLLNQNDVSNSGAKELCKVLPSTDITNFELHGNPIRDPNLFYCASGAFAPKMPLPFRLLKYGSRTLSRLFHSLKPSLDLELPFRFDEEITRPFRLQETLQIFSLDGFWGNSENATNDIFAALPSGFISDQELQTTCFRAKEPTFFGNMLAYDADLPMLNYEDMSTQEKPMSSNLILLLLTAATLILCSFPYRQAKKLIANLFCAFSSSEPPQILVGFFSKSQTTTTVTEVLGDSCLRV